MTDDVAVRFRKVKAWQAATSLLARFGNNNKLIKGKRYEYAEDALGLIRLIPFDEAWHGRVYNGIATTYEDTLRTDLITRGKHG